MIDQKGLVRAQRARIPEVSYSWGPRPALDGVRAIAVYLVVLFHGGLAAFEGGFIGVDLLDPILCPDLPMCVPWIKGMVAFTDRHHIGLAYAEHIAPALDRRLEAAGVYGETSR